MNKRIPACLAAALAALAIAGCSDMSRSEKDTAVGAVVGGVVGHEVAKR